MSNEPQNWWIKVVPRAIPNADGRWVDCGEHSLTPGQRNSFKGMVFAPGSFCPQGHEIVALSSKNPEGR